MAVISFSHALPKVKELMTHSLGAKGCTTLWNLGYLAAWQAELSDGLRQIMIL